jgi:hypothetical protein
MCGGAARSPFDAKPPLWQPRSSRVTTAPSASLATSICSKQTALNAALISPAPQMMGQHHGEEGAGSRQLCKIGGD